MPTPSAFDPQQRDPDFYANDPKNHPRSDNPNASEGVGVGNTLSSGTSGMDMDTESLRTLTETREANQHEGDPDLPTGETIGSSQPWDVNTDTLRPKGQIMSDDDAEKLSKIADNPSDDALLHRADATYLESQDDPNKGYDPHDRGYTDRDKTSAQ